MDGIPGIGEKKRAEFGAEIAFAARIAFESRDEQGAGLLRLNNVAQDGRAIQFLTAKGRAGAENKPFVFFCRDAEEARKVVALLPKRVDENFVAKADFNEKLRRVATERHALASVTNVIIALNVVVFVVMAGFLGAGWWDVTDTTPYILYGANNGAATTDGEWWRLVTSMFMHFGVIHLLLNMWALFQTGPLVERLLGRALYTFIYLASGVGGSLLSIGWHGDKMWSAGASGAIFGVYGALLGYMLSEKQALPRPVFQPMLKSTLTFAGYNLFYGLIHPGIDNAAHVGGFVTGVGLGWLAAMPLEAALRVKLFRPKLRLAGAAFGVLVAVGIAAAPRFNYSVREERRWIEATKGFIEGEPALLSQLNTELPRWRQRGDNAATMVRLVEQDLTPFYAEFGRRIDALVLAPGRVTAERRKTLSKFVQIRLGGYQHLLRAVKEKNQSELRAYGASEKQAAEVIESFRSARK
jgi:rhomboid protease GluP